MFIEWFGEINILYDYKKLLKKPCTATLSTATTVSPSSC